MVDRPATREQIVDAAVALLPDAPDEALTIARLAKAVGLTPMALHRRFKDRDELIDEVVGASSSSATPPSA